MTKIKAYYHQATRWLCITTWFQLVVSILWVLGSLLFACATDRAEYFARSGSIMGLIGGVMTFRRHLRGMDNNFLRDIGEANQPAFNRIDPQIAHMQAPEKDAKAVKLGIMLVVLGTLLWGYGDLLLVGIRVCSH